MNAVLPPNQIEQFIELGYCTLPEAFTTNQAAAACRALWQRIEEKAGIRQADPSTWPSHYDIQEHLTDPDVLATFTDRLAAAVEQLVGSGRWCGRRKWGLWPVNFSYGADRPYDFPATHWHIDGNYFRHTLDCRKQGLLLIGLFTEVQPRWGGTVLALGSHKRTAHVLAGHPEGIAHRDLFREVLAQPIGNFHEVTGAAGDVVLAHPFLFHTKGFKPEGPPRVISNTEAALREPMNFQRPREEDYSVLEQSIRRALRQIPAPPAEGRLCCF
jgi:hypothetical protein